jgi:hypothetical protein
MTREEAIAWYHRITGGNGLDRNAALRTLQRGSIAEGLWDDPTFTYGIEYGVLIALIEVFDLQPEDLV